MAPDKYTVLVDPAADQRFAVHVEFLARVSENAAVKLYDDYEEALNFLGGFPKNCPVYTPQMPIDAQLRYKLFGKRYRIVFEIIDNTVYVYDIQDCRQDYNKNLV